MSDRKPLPQGRPTVPMFQIGVKLEDMERQIILYTLHFFKENREACARALGVSVKTIFNKLEKYEADNQVQIKQEEEYQKKRAEWLKRARAVPGQDPFSDAGLYNQGHNRVVPSPIPQVVQNEATAIEEAPVVRKPNQGSRR